jgi:hypothetical protein
MASPHSILIDESRTQYPFITLKGQLHSPQLQLEDISRRGVSGSAVRELARTGRLFQMIGTVDADDLAAGDVLRQDLAFLQGQILSVIDDFGVQADGYICHDVQVLSMRPLLNAAGGVSSDAGALLTVQFTLQSGVPDPPFGFGSDNP